MFNIVVNIVVQGVVPTRQSSPSEQKGIPLFLQSKNYTVTRVRFTEESLLIVKR